MLASNGMPYKRMRKKFEGLPAMMISEIPGGIGLERGLDNRLYRDGKKAGHYYNINNCTWLCQDGTVIDIQHGVIYHNAKAIGKSYHIIRWDSNKDTTCSQCKSIDPYTGEEATDNMIRVDMENGKVFMCLDCVLKLWTW